VVRLCLVAYLLAFFLQSSNSSRIHSGTSGRSDGRKPNGIRPVTICLFSSSVILPSRHASPAIIDMRTQSARLSYPFRI
jgi:hypothetical protein